MLGVVTIVTWNVWFGELARVARFEALVQAAVGADFICLQEVVPWFAARVRGHPAVQDRYVVSPNEIDGYGLLILVDRAIAHEVSFREVALPSRMGRSLLVATTPHWTVATVHLESLNSATLRERQLEVIAATLGDDGDVERPQRKNTTVVCGDFNFDSRQRWGDWRLPPERRAPAEALENRILAEVLSGWTDCWLALEEDDDAGLTFDGAANPCVTNRLERMRYDRIMLGPGAAYTPVKIDLLGRDPIDDHGTRPSDHYGVRLDLRASHHP